MRLHEKIRRIRKEKGVSLTGLEAKLVKIFGRRALRYNTLYRIEKGMREARASSLSQICIGLGISLKELKEGTAQQRTAASGKIARTDRTVKYVYSEKAVAELLCDEALPFLAMRLMLQPGAKTKVEQDPAASGRYYKWVYCLKGVVGVTLGKESYRIRKGETIWFESTIPHSLANDSGRNAACILMQDPRRI